MLARNEYFLPLTSCNSHRKAVRLASVALTTQRRVARSEGGGQLSNVTQPRGRTGREEHFLQEEGCRKESGVWGEV